MSRRVGAVVAAAGEGARLGIEAPKALVEVGGMSLVARAVSALRAAGITTVVVVHPSDARAEFARVLADLDVLLIPGGETRTASVRAGLAALPADAEVVAVHDAARGLTPPETIRSAVAAVTGDVVAAAPALPVADTLKRVESGRVVTTVSRDGLWAVQTPQVFLREVVEAAHRHVEQPTSDDLAVVEAALEAGVVEGEIAVVGGAAAARKVTWPEDLDLAEAVVGASEETAARVGSGIDVHAFDSDPDRALVLGGVRIDDAPGLAGHSDADVVCHALADALLGATGGGDLGSRFGVDDPEMAGARSLELLRGLVEAMAAQGLSVLNADVTIVAARPRLAEHREAMVTALSGALETAAVSVKMTTTDGLGALGRGEGIGCWATCLVGGPRDHGGRQ